MVLDAAEEAVAMVAAVRHDPALRVELASRFYDDRPGHASIRAYRRAEVAFMRWQVSRGVLAPAESARPGSGWWRSVNESLLRDACEADRLAAGTPGQPSRPTVARWTGFLRAPSARTWYRAHNASIVAAYLEHHQLCAAEVPVERFFMDVTIARLMFAHALVIRPRLAVGRLAPAGRLLGDPRWRGADLFLSLHNILPDWYPLTGFRIDQILALENYAAASSTTASSCRRCRRCMSSRPATSMSPGCSTWSGTVSLSMPGHMRTGTRGPRPKRLLPGPSCPG